MTADPTRRTDRAARMIAASPDAVYAALTDAEAVAAWLPPQGMRGRVIAFEPRPGGRFALALTYVEGAGDGHGKTGADADVTEGRFVALEPGRRVVQTARFESDDPDLAGEMILTWELAPEGADTHVAISAADVPPGIAEADHQDGLASSLDNLARWLEEREG